jgi:hypothetical protein
MAKYRGQRYDQSRAENGQFYYGPRSILLYGAASFLYELMPSGTRAYTPDFATISSFFGAARAAGGKPGNATGGYDAVPERIPARWTNRVAPYTLLDVTAQIVAQYAAYPRAFGANAGVGNFEPLALPTGGLTGNSTSEEVACAFYNLFRENTPGMWYLKKEWMCADDVMQVKRRCQRWLSSGR